MVGKRVVVSVAVGLLLGGCASRAARPQDGTATTDAASSAVITGTLRESGGPMPGLHPIAATVTAGDYTEKAGDDGVYRLVVPPGTYGVKLTWGNAQCQSSSVTVQAGQTAAVDLFCDVK